MSSARLILTDGGLALSEPWAIGGRGSTKVLTASSPACSGDAETRRGFRRAGGPSKMLGFTRDQERLITADRRLRLCLGTAGLARKGRCALRPRALHAPSPRVARDGGSGDQTFQIAGMLFWMIGPAMEA